MHGLVSVFRSQIRYKIIFPYLALTLIVMMTGAAIAVGLVAASWEERLQNQLAQVARNSTDALVRRERNHLEFLRQVVFAPANNDIPAVADAFASGDSDTVIRALDPYYRFGVGSVNLDFDRCRFRRTANIGRLAPCLGKSCRAATAHSDDRSLEPGFRPVDHLRWNDRWK
jgi:PAS/PAC sensor signal transduction histidine kinase (EC 2.7.13.3)